MISCFYYRVVHIETLEDMTTDCLLLALRCFMSLRGPVKSITGDDPDLKSYLEENVITLKFNSPDASHQGGATERMIRTARAVLNGMRQKYRMIDTKTQRTAFYEAANIMNSRPLTGTKINIIVFIHG